MDGWSQDQGVEGGIKIRRVVSRLGCGRRNKDKDVLSVLRAGVGRR